MAEIPADPIRASLTWQGQVCRKMGSPGTAALCDAAAVVLDRSTETGRRMLDWPGDPRGDALPLRLTGGMHALALAGEDAGLVRIYGGSTEDAGPIVEAALHRFDDRLVRWLESPPQTNEVGRSSVVMAGLLAAADRLAMPFELIELGASAGLNLNLDRYRYDLGGVEAGDPQSSVQLAPEWQGPPPPRAEVSIVRRSGVDIRPVRLAEPGGAERLLAYVWGGQTARLERLKGAILIAERCPPPLEEGNAAPWIEAKLAEPQAEGVARIVFHTIFLQYPAEEDRTRIVAAIRAAGAAATAERPFGWLSMEMTPDGKTVSLTLTLWPGGEPRQLATVHPHGNAIDWAD